MAKIVESKGKAQAATAATPPATASIQAPKPRPGYAELYATGKKLRAKRPRESHAGWKPARDRHDPLELLLKSSEGRIQELLPIRYGRMLKSPFTFYRGAALNMAADLSGTPVTGLCSAPPIP